MSEKEDPASGAFHVDKRVPVALIVTMLVQTAGIVWWAATISAAQANALVEARRIELRVERVEGERDDIKTRVIRIEEKLVNQTDTLQQILRSVQRDTQPGRN
jgi:hypothetical protein